MMNNIDSLKDMSFISDDGTLVIHDAYKKELHRLCKVHQHDLDDLEKCYKEQILFIIKEKESISSQLVSILQSLIECFQQKLNVEHQQVNNKIYSEQINFINEAYQDIIELHVIKEKFLFNQMLKLKMVIMEERKTNANISSKFILLKEKHCILKQYLDELNKSTTTRFILKCLATEMFFREKDDAAKRSKIWCLIQSVLLVFIFVWSLLRLEKFCILVLLNIIGVWFFIMF